MGAAHILRRFQRRSAARYKLRLPVIFHWNEGIEHTSGGFTCDVALNGALILCRECPPVGSEVRVEILLPSPEMENEEIRISCTGKVIHSSRRMGYSEFGFHGVFQDDQLTRNVLDFENHMRNVVSS
jgi:PilZ domain-containing protein